jgi:SAM-dependent methyltransferase
MSIGSAQPQPAAFCIKPDYTPRRSAVPYTDTDGDDGLVWQPDIYARVVPSLARRLGAERVVDVGCGNGHKLARLHPDLQIVGIDLRRNVRVCRRRYDFGTWIVHDLESKAPLPLLPSQHRRSVVVCADVVEHLVRPDRLMQKLRAALSYTNVVVVSTPDRNRLHGERATGPPHNGYHVREWAYSEFDRWLDELGFRYRRLTYTRTSNTGPAENTILAHLFADHEVLRSVFPE